LWYEPAAGGLPRASYGIARGDGGLIRLLNFGDSTPQASRRDKKCPGKVAVFCQAAPTSDGSGYLFIVAVGGASQ